MRKEVYITPYAQVLVDEDNHYFVRYDYGSIATDIREIPLTAEEAKQVMKMNDWKEFGFFLRTDCYKRWINAASIKPSEYVGDTVKLIMG